MSGHQLGLRSGQEAFDSSIGLRPSAQRIRLVCPSSLGSSTAHGPGCRTGALTRQARAVTDEYLWAVIDCPPGITRVNADAIRASDLVLIPCKPRVWDVWACEDIVDAVKLRQAGNRGRPRAAFVISMGRPRTRFSQRISTALADLGLPILQGRTTEREAYALAAGEGRSVLDGRDRVAKAEIDAICKEVLEMCDDIRTKTPIIR